MKKTTISVSAGLRNRIKHAKNVTFSRTYENFLNDLLDRDKIFSNEEKSYMNRKNIKAEIEKIKYKRNTKKS